MVAYNMHLFGKSPLHHDSKIRTTYVAADCFGVLQFTGSARTPILRQRIGWATFFSATLSLPCSSRWVGTAMPTGRVVFGDIVARVGYEREQLTFDTVVLLRGEGLWLHQ